MIQLYLDIAINLAVFVNTLIVFVYYFKLPPDTARYTGLKTLRFFTTLSNIFAALTSLMAVIWLIKLGYRGCFAALPEWLHLLKFMSTAAVSLTMFTVLFFLGPTKGYKRVLSGTSFYMHLLGPLLAIISLCFLENQVKLGFGRALLGMVPTVLYGAVYTYEVIVVGEENGGWPDLYGFNRTGKWKRSIFLMFLGSFLICLFLMKVHNLQSA